MGQIGFYSFNKLGSDPKWLHQRTCLKNVPCALTKIPNACIKLIDENLDTHD